MKEIQYSSINTSNFISLIGLFVGFALPIYIGESLLVAMMFSLFGFIVTKFMFITKCYRISYNDEQIVLVNAILPFLEYCYKISDVKEIFEIGVMNWGDGINIIDHSGRLRTFGTDGSNNDEITEMIDFVKKQMTVKNRVK